jgi:hypothetical protein
VLDGVMVGLLAWGYSWLVDNGGVVLVVVSGI